MKIIVRIIFIALSIVFALFFSLLRFYKTNQERQKVALNLIKKNSFLKILYLHFNIFIRNIKFFSSHSQFNEEKKIFKLFKKKGTYLDLGCFHPIRYNNTFLLFKSGWSGINIDLNPLSIELFNVARPNDVNICTAISDKESVKNLYFYHNLSPINTLSKKHTLLVKDIFGTNYLQKKKIRTQKLNSLLKKNNIKKIDYFNIDIEGYELQVLKTIDFDYFDIKVICVEIITSSKNIKKKEKKIIQFLKKKKYTFKFKTGINHVFVRNKRYKGSLI